MTLHPNVERIVNGICKHDRVILIPFFYNGILNYHSILCHRFHPKDKEKMNLNNEAINELEIINPIRGRIFYGSLHCSNDVLNRFLCATFKFCLIKEWAADSTKTLPLSTSATRSTQNSMTGCNGRFRIRHSAFKDFVVDQHIPDRFFAGKDQSSFSPPQLRLDAPEISPTTIALVGQLEQRTRMSCHHTQQILDIHWPDMCFDKGE
mmetsp:Transcript_13659/g.17350  ORF Transcript_13659/g.17350 Transcript_13659/m.17350 type:complete len:207 (-) Transcript_13659:326-946(-)